MDMDNINRLEKLRNLGNTTSEVVQLLNDLSKYNLTTIDVESVDRLKKVFEILTKEMLKTAQEKN